MNFKTHIIDIASSLRKENILILSYHSISEYKNIYCVRPDEFKKQMNLIAKSDLLVINLREAVHKIIEKKINRKYLVLTFDDGYYDSYQNALPVLKNLNFPATFFVVTNSLGKWNTWDNWPLKIMDLQNIIELYKAGHTIGAHTHTHQNLAFDMNMDKLSFEINTPYQFLKEEINPDFIPFSYPYGSGSQNQKIYEIVKKVYDCAAISQGDWGNNVNSDIWRLKRVRVNRDTDMKKFIGLTTEIFNRDFVENLFKSISG